MKTITTNVCQKSLVVSAMSGLHLYPAALLVRTASDFVSDISVCCGDLRADAKSIISVISLEAEHGTTVTVEIEGADAEEAMQEIVGLFERNFGS